MTGPEGQREGELEEGKAGEESEESGARGTIGEEGGSQGLLREWLWTE